MSGIGGHESPRMKTDEWFTPPYIVAALGKFDLDPCSPVDRVFETAEKYYTKKQNGLTMPWSGRVWCNPPYGRETEKWLKKMSEHQNGIALIFARTETKMFWRYIWGAASSVLFIKGRLTFFQADGTQASGNAGGPSCLVAYGNNNTDALRKCKIAGHLCLVKE